MTSSIVRRSLAVARWEGTTGLLLRALLMPMLAASRLIKRLFGIREFTGVGRAGEIASWLEEFVFTIRLQRALLRESRQGRLRTFRDLGFGQKRKSDTVFILGSGPSINELTDDQWKIVGQHDSIGMNFWIVHPFVPDVLFFEMNKSLSERNDVFLRLAGLRAGDYIDTPFVYFHRSPMPGEGRWPEELKDNLYHLAAFRSNFTERGNTRSLKLACSLRHCPSIRYEMAVNPGAMLGMVTMLCVLAGYKNIVLLGTDLNTPLYFWEERPERFASLPKPPSAQSGNVHATADRDKMHENTIDSFIERLMSVFAPHVDFELLVGSKSSALYPRLGLYTFERSGADA